jgi:disulfide bond formation protein DsbB
MAYEGTISPLLAFAALGAVAGGLLLMFASDAVSWGPLNDFVYDHTQKLMLLVAAGATASSLYYSEAVGFVPCEFCWYQRIAMYPLFGLLALAFVSRLRLDSRYIVALAFVGLGLSSYHYHLQMFADHARVCSGPVSCSGKYVEELGFVTIPFMAGCGFLTILLLRLAEWRVEHRSWQSTEADADDDGEETRGALGADSSVFAGR